jgi:hypothetical protein
LTLLQRKLSGTNSVEPCERWDHAAMVEIHRTGTSPLCNDVLCSIMLASPSRRISVFRASARTPHMDLSLRLLHNDLLTVRRATSSPNQACRSLSV